MPTYRNTSNEAALLGPYGKIEAGGTIETDLYLTQNDLGTSFSLVSGGPSPWYVYKFTNLPAAVTYGLAKYAQLSVYNATDKLVLVSPNHLTGDSVSLPIASGMIYPVTQKREIDALRITGDGSGSVYLMCTGA